MISPDTLILLYRWAEWRMNQMSVRSNLASLEKLASPYGDTIEPLYIPTERSTAPRRVSKMEDVNACVLSLPDAEQELVCKFATTPQTTEGLRDWQSWINRKGRGYQRLRKSLARLEQLLEIKGLV